MTDREIKPDEIGEEIPEEIEQFLVEIGTNGYQVAIRRIEPEWCKGYLDTWSLDTPFKLRTLRDVYGGKKFMCRIMNDRGKYVRCFTVDIDDEPKREGIILKRFPADTPPVQYLLPPDAATRNPANPDLRILEMLESNRKEQVQFLTALLMKDRQQSDPLSQMQSAAKMTAALREMAGSFGDGGEGEGGNTGVILKAIMAIMDAKNKAQPQPQPQAPHPPQRRPAPPVLYRQSPSGVPVAHPSTVTVPVAQPPSPRPSPAPVAKTPPVIVPNPEPEGPEEPDLVDDLLDLEPTEAGKVIGEYFASLPEAEQQIVLSGAMSLVQNEVDADSKSDTLEGSGLESQGREASPASPTSVHGQGNEVQTPDNERAATQDDPLDRTGNCNRF
jgi:hypothetical protein